MIIEPVRVKVKMPAVAAKVTFLIGDYHSIEKWIPHALDTFNAEVDSYTARCAFYIMNNTRYPFNVVIHCREFNLGTLVHEMVHAVNFIQGAMGIKPDFDNDELTAYMMDYLYYKVDKAHKRVTP